MSVRKELYFLAVALVVTFVGCEGGNVSTANASLAPFSDTKTAQGVVKRKLGNGVRSYEFTPETMPNHRCIFVEDHNEGGIYCTERYGGLK
ncbi:TMhelix containing protein [Vibrio phage 1.215.B._10N.222.54.F7]|nr:TMhelix containing protein [Vibrio phage 1.215.A._10N.222.54.F7]AUR96061.1 TMhelix containing protein [Vibrio phage 1.215.B._10N.222.54.F7]